MIRSLSSRGTDVFLTPRSDTEGPQDPYPFDKQVQDRMQFGKEDRIVIPGYQCRSHRCYKKRRVKQDIMVKCCSEQSLDTVKLFSELNAFSYKIDSIFIKISLHPTPHRKVWIFVLIQFIVTILSHHSHKV